MGFESPCSQSSRIIVIDRTDVVYRVDRQTDDPHAIPAVGDVLIDWYESGASASTQLGVALQNRTGQNMYLWYGAIPKWMLVNEGTPEQTIDIDMFKQHAFLLPADSIYEPYRLQSFCMYFAADASGILHHMVY